MHRKRSRLDATPTQATALATLLACRLCCLEARSQSDLDAAEAFLRRYIEKGASQTDASTTCDDLFKATEWLTMLLLQSGRPAEATPLLDSGGYTVRLASAVISCQLSPSRHPTLTALPCAAVDNAVPTWVWLGLRHALGAIDADYWTSHNYSIEPPSPYFSYVLPLADASRMGNLGTLITAVRDVARKALGPAIDAARFVEMWAHNRPHGSGHQLHFDSDDEGRGGIRHPIVSSAFFLEGNVGGPTLVSTQRLGDKELGDGCWLCPPQANRLVVFDGSVLHGVLPGRGVSPSPGARRVTFMIAFWKEIAIRNEPGVGSARPFPNTAGPNVPKWVGDLHGAGSAKGAQSRVEEATPVEPVFVQQLWEKVNGKVWPKKAPIPPYDSVFQGF